MTRIMYDAVTPANCPGDGQLYAGYIDGNYRSYDEMVTRFPGAIHVAIAVNPGTNAGIVLDCESGDATPGQAPGWVQMRRAAGVDPTVYCSESPWGEVINAFNAAGVAQPHYWIAAYDNNPVIFPGSVAHQYASTNYDTSVVADFWPGVDGSSPPPVRHNSGAQMLITDQTNGKVWLLGPGKAVEKTSVPADWARLEYVGVGNAGFADPLTIISWMKTFGAW